MRTAIFVALAILLLLSLCQPVAAARDVRVALTELRPTLFTDDQGKPAGFFVDLINDIAAQEGWNIIWVRGSLSGSWDRLSSGEIDLLPGVADTPERENLFDFGHEPALSVWSQVYARPGSGINTILDLDGKRITSVRGALSGIAFQDYARKFGINATYLEKDTPAEVFAATASGEADALVVYNTAGQEDAVTYGLAATPVMFNPAQFSFATQKGKNQDLLIVIDRYIAQGKGDPSSTYSRTMQKWFGIKSSPIIPPWLLWGFVAAVFVIILFVTMSVILRREVRKKTAELVRKNDELRAAYEQLSAAGEELKDNYLELGKSEKALLQARKKLTLLNTLTIQDIQTGIFSLTGYFHLAKQNGCSSKAEECLDKGWEILQNVENSLHFAKKYQNLGISQPRWQNVNLALLNALSHLDFSRISRSVDLGSLEVYADPLLEDVFVTLMENVLIHGAGATEVRLRYEEKPGGITILVEDNGPGIPAKEKESIFSGEYHHKGVTGLFLAREILSITGISIRETGEPGTGARFEITVPKDMYRSAGKD
ncbi:MAG: transporter substrate-binding domain-containing protein [Methanoregula sp.]|nr:transporter substrate-binding domain-containing protein [Methanoregula sp.]